MENMNQNSEMTDADDVPPRADVLMESLRANGYSLPDAVADLIDNSIAAGAKHIWMTFHWAGSESWFSLVDDGGGMNTPELVNAMRMGSQSPLVERDPSDLGRYGMGMKTASISQARSLTVGSKDSKKANICIRRWDLDHIGVTKSWSLLRSATATGAELSAQLQSMAHGTFVLWEKPDKFVGDVKVSDNRARTLFHQAVSVVEQHVSMVFHRFMAGRGAVVMWINEQPVKPWDPFLSDKASTQRLQSEPIGSSESPILVEPFVLPHHTGLTTEEHSAAGGPGGWNDQQGFYVYRNKRLLLGGDWLGLGYKKEEHYKLARILVDLPNSMDHEWEIDLKKSKARPPAALRDDLKRIARIVRERAVTVYRHRGKTLARTNSTGQMFVWHRKIKSKKISYEVNRDHPIVKSALDSANGDSSGVRKLIRLVEEYIPIQQIWIDSAEGSEAQSQPFETSRSAELVEMIQMLYRAYVQSGLNHDEAMDRLNSTEAYGERYELIENAVKNLKIGGEH
jgi:hypothetical protein